jgi:hypothetical protein
LSLLTTFSLISGLYTHHTWYILLSEAAIRKMLLSLG